MRTRVVVRAAVLCVISGCGLTIGLDPPAQDRDAGRDSAAGDARLDMGPDTRADTGVDTGPGVPCADVVDCPDDGDPCNGTPTCIDGVCDPGEPINCDDGDPCNGVEACAEGACITSPPMTCADDGDACNGTEECLPDVGCTSVEPLDCDDDVLCTDDVCDPVSGCTHMPNDGACRRALGGTCDPINGCQYPECILGDTCLADACTGVRCEDDTCVRENLCGSGQTCCGGACVPRNCDDGNPCTADACSAGMCINSPVDGTPCSDGNSCTIGDTCIAGSCVGLTAQVCNDGNPCTQNVCDPLIGCRYPPQMGTTVTCNLNAYCSGTACACASGYEDCDANGSCECAVGGCSGGTCTLAMADCWEPCFAGEECCDVPASGQYGNCVPRSCLGEPGFDGCCRATH